MLSIIRTNCAHRPKSHRKHLPPNLSHCPIMSNQAEYHVPTNRSDSADANGAHSTTPSVRHIPIFVEGRDEPLINRNHDSTSGHHQSAPLNQQHSSSSTTSTTTHSKRPTSGPSPNPFDWSRKFAQMGGLQSTTSTAAAAPPPQPHQHTSSTRNESPQRTIPVSHSAPPSVHHHTASATPRQHPYAQHTQSEGRATPDTPPQHQQQQSSAPSPSQHNAEPHQRPQPPKQQQQQPQQHAAEPQYAAPRSGAPDVAFTKITQIQVNVLELMDQVRLRAK